MYSAPRNHRRDAARCDLGEDGDGEQREEIDQHHEIDPPLPLCVVLIDLAAHQPGDDHHPEREQPPVEAHHQAERDQQEDHTLARRDPLLGVQERLPQEKQPEMREQQRARPRVGDAAENGDVQKEQHRDHYQSPIALAEGPRRIGESREQGMLDRGVLHGGGD